VDDVPVEELDKIGIVEVDEVPVVDVEDEMLMLVLVLTLTLVLVVVAESTGGVVGGGMGKDAFATIENFGLLFPESPNKTMM